ncbi:unnamed protein product [Auanema sp. JU1783]|nr:unnamed protein product [Auanema sp. JU1783]
MLCMTIYALLFLIINLPNLTAAQDSLMQSSDDLFSSRSARSSSSIKMNRYVREPMDRSSMIRFGKRAPMDRSAMIRFGKRLNLHNDFSRFLKRAPLDRSSMIRFGKRNNEN